MEWISQQCRVVSKSVCSSFKSCGYVLRPRASAGLWLIPLVPASLIFSWWKHVSLSNGAVSNLYFSTMVVSCGLLISTILYILRFFPRAGMWIRDFNTVFIFPAIGTLIILLCSQNSFILSLLGGILSSYGILAGLPSLLTVAPGCFTLGEATVVVHSVVLFWFCAIANLSHVAFSHISLIENTTYSYETATVIIQTGVLGLSIMISLLVIIPFLRQPKQFYFLFGIGTTGILTVLHILLNGSPILWMMQFFSRDHNTVVVLVCWLMCSIMGVFVVWYQSEVGKKASTAQRKVFHVLAVAVFAGGLLYVPDLLYLSSGVIFAIFITLEALRILHIPPLSKSLQSAFGVFVDEKDGTIALTPIYLLTGVAAPLWISPVSNIPISKSHLLPFFAGLLSVGIGDTAASFVGSRFGRIKWSGNSRTVEGSAACFLTQLLAIAVSVYCGLLPEDLSYFKIIGALGLTTLIEAKTDQVDNLVLPLTLYVMLL